MIFNFSGAFWNTLRSYRNSQAFDELLAKEDVELGQVLDDEDVVQEMRNQNPKLLALCVLDSFSTDRLQELLDLLIVEPPADADNRRGNKHPFIACELIGCEVPGFIQSFTDDPALMTQFFSLLRVEKLNLTLAGYFAKTFGVIMTKNAPVLLNYLFGEPHYITLVLAHIHSRSISECVFRVLTYEDASLFLTERRGLLESLLDLLASDDPLTTLSTVSVITESLQKSGDMKGWKDVFSELCSQQALLKMFQALARDSPTCVRATLTILSALIVNPGFSELLGDGMVQFEEMLEGSMTLIEDLIDSREQEAVDTTFGQSGCLGETKLRSLDLIWSVYRLENKSLQAIICRSRCPLLATDLFFSHPWNSFLHHIYWQLVQCVLSSTDLETKRKFIQSSDLPQKLIDLKTAVPLDSGKEIRSGLLGHAVRVGQLVSKAIDAAPELKETVKNEDDWKKFLDEFLNPILEEEKHTYGGTKPSEIGDEDSDDQKDLKDGEVSLI